MEYEKQPGKAGCVENCRRIKAEWVKAARAGVDPVSVCGHHCDFCFLGQWCGGCRSGYNCCSFATISPDGICPQVKCADEKGLEGCWLCTELDGCAKGYYGNQDEYVAKATAMFIRKHGKETYTEALRRACWSNTVKGEVRAPPTLQSRPCDRASSPQGEPLIRKNVRCQASP